jgi:hypothetical protein
MRVSKTITDNDVDPINELRLESVSSRNFESAF